MTHAKKTALAGALLAVLAASACLAPAHAAADPSAVAPERAAAIHDCNIKANAFSMYAWGGWHIYVYRTCMAEHHQTE